MQRSFIPVALALLLGACTSTVLTPEEKALPEEAAAFEFTENPQVDYTQSYVAFTGKSNIINHEGVFESFNAEFLLSPADTGNLEAATLSVTLDVASMRTDAERLDGHLQKEDFFHAELYPQVTFESTAIEHLGGNDYRITGDLTAKGVTKSVAFDAEITGDYMTLSYDLPRREFGIGNDSYGDKLLEPLVPIEAKLVFVR